MLRDRLVCGVNHEGLQRRLLAEKELTYEKAVELALATETAEKGSQDLKNSSASGGQQHSFHLAQHAGRLREGNDGGARARQDPIVCYRCGKDHLASVCRHKETVCRFCRKKGHLAKVCRSKRRQGDQPQHRARDQGKKANKNAHHLDQDVSSDEVEYEMFKLSNKGAAPYLLDVFLNDVSVKMELDTGASVSVITTATYRRIQQQAYVAPLQPTETKLRSYSGEYIQVQGITQFKVRYANKELFLSIHVVKEDGPNLMGRDWLNYFEVNLRDLNVVTEQHSLPLKAVLDRYAAVFSEEIGCLQGSPVKLAVRENATPKFYKPRPVPFLLKKRVEEEIDSLQAQGIISPVQFSPSATPVVPVPKKNGKVRLCGDFKLTVNQVLNTETYPLPRIEEIFANLNGGKLFTKLDMSNAYLQLPLDEDSKTYVTINTHKGLFKFNRLPFGVSSAPAIFQRYMETLLQGFQGVSVYIDDVLITGRSTEEHLQNLEKVLEKIQAVGLRLNRDKCFFMQQRIEYLGHVIDETGIHPTEEKVRAIKEAPQPRDVTSLRSFLGLTNYYAKFLPNLSAKLAPLYKLLNNKQEWCWGREQEEAFQAAKDALQTDAVLVHYDPAKPLVIACDASQYGIGAVLSHTMEDKQERPVAYVSRTLSPAEKRYSQLEKEALAIVFAVKKFHKYVYGRHFEIESDHRPLSFLFSENKGVPQMASARIQRWAITLSAYHYTIRYKAGKHLGNADAFSRLPRPVTIANDHVPEELELLMNHLSATSIGAANIKAWTNRDPLLSCVRRFIMSGWPDKELGEEYHPYTSRKHELSVFEGCVLWASRVVVPPQGRQSILEELHETHPGVNKMKSLARMYLWWPGMDADITRMVKACPVCQESRPSPATAPLHPWEWPSQPWSRIHLDFAGPFLGHMFLVIVDAHSKWLDVHQMQSITSSKTIEKLRIVFATHGLPQKVVTDNGPSFTSEEFRTFMSLNGIVHVTTSPYHPSSNGLAERAVQTFKQGLKRTPGSTIQERLSKFLFTYRITPHTTTGVPPAMLLMGRLLRCRWDSLFPNPAEKVESQQSKQAQQHDSTKPLRTFQVGDRVYVKDFSTTPVSWIPGKVVKITGPLSYHVELISGRVVRRHVDAVRHREANYFRTPPQSKTASSVDDFLLPDIPLAHPAPRPDVVGPPPPPPPPPPLPLRRSTRQRRPPIRL